MYNLDQVASFSRQSMSLFCLCALVGLFTPAWLLKIVCAVTLLLGGVAMLYEYMMTFEEKKKGQLLSKPAPIHRPDWVYTPFASVYRNGEEDIKTLVHQRTLYFTEQIPQFFIDLLQQQKNYAVFGWHVNNYVHSLQMATIAWRHDPNDLEMIVMALLHDVLYYVMPDTHGEIAYYLLIPYFRPDVLKILRYHDVMVESEAITGLGIPEEIKILYEAEKDSNWMKQLRIFRSWDGVTNDPGTFYHPIEFFEPMVREVITWKKYNAFTQPKLIDL